MRPPRPLSIAALVILAAVTAQGTAARQTVPLTRGMVIDRSVTIRPGTYRLSSVNLSTPAITIRGDNITVDFNGAVLAGGDPAADPDGYEGVGILIDGGSRVTLKNAGVRGYKVGILARRSPDLHLTRNDLSYNWKQRLQSGVEKESLVDWMSYHQNEKDEWLRFGAGIYLSQCDRAEIDHTTIVQGQNGLMVTASKGLKIWNNTFQFLSSLGVGLYRVSESTVMHNRIDWCVRGYSHGFYNRGQDSAGLLMYEQSSHNTVAYNSVTHGGDGLFLWAGQSTMDTGKGGANDNLFYANDFSHAPTNGIEATFSRNRFINNHVEENWHGVWGGYSYDSVWQGNRFVRNAEAMAIEHGQNNVIETNTFEGDQIAIRLWQNPAQDPNWGYPKNRDTTSRGYSLTANAFRDHKTAVQLRDTKNVRLYQNTFASVATPVERTGDTSGFVDAQGDALAIIMFPAPPKMPGGIDPLIPAGARRGRETIVVDEWGPYDWKSPKLWPVLEGGSKPLPYAPAPGPTPTPRVTRLNVLGPDGDWKVASARGATVTPQSGRTGDTIVVTPAAGPNIDWRLALEYRGQEATSPRGVKTPAGQPYRFEYGRFVPAIAWTIKWFDYTDATDPVKQPAAFAKLLADTPAKQALADNLHYLTGRSVEDGLPRDRVAFVAEGEADLPAGDYTLQVISDDGARVWMDGKLILDAWAPHESRVDSVTIGGGRHRFKVEYYEIGGFAELRFNILQGR